MAARTRWALAFIFLLWAAWLAVDPPSRSNWLFGNIPTAVFLLGLGATMVWRPLSDTSYVLAFTFLALHEYGTHHGYQVPLLDGDRNHYDRIVHAAFGALLTPVVRDVLVRSGKADGAWAWFLAVALMLAGAALYEITEWLGALVFYDGPAEAFLGHQGDHLDATKDMALSLGASLAAASLGAVLTRPRHRA